MPLTRFSAANLAPITAADLVPPPRFAAKSFADYRIDSAVAGQAEAVAQVRDFASIRPGFFASLFGRGGKAGLYLDGGFGVGKTHLLAASFHLATGSKRYLSFAEAMSLLTVRGKDAAIDLLAADLVCIDEFELDDPTNTRLADLLTSGLMARKSRLITTSNTVPGELGQGRMAVDLFRAQLARIEEFFADVHVPGNDWRLRQTAAGQPPDQWGPGVESVSGEGWVTADVHQLDRWLSDIPVINLRRVASLLRGLTITEVEPFSNQLAALRFVHLVDKLYDYNVAVRVRTTTAITDLFPAEHCQAAFAKKYRRCQSRLAELCRTESR
jgi:cell division protein ZapE